MDDPLQGLIRELRNEKCPPAVFDRVAQRIAREKDKRVSRQPQWALAFALVAIFALGTVAVWQRPAPRNAPLTVAANTRADRALVVRQAEGALVSIGQALIEAAAQTEKIVLKGGRSAVAE